MYQIIETPANVVGMRFSGTITKDDILAAEKNLDAKLATDEPFGVVVDFTGFEDAKSAAIIEDIRYESGLLGKLKRFPKVAILTDKSWFSALVGFLSPLVPFVEIKSFAPDQLTEAVAFASVLPTP